MGEGGAIVSDDEAFMDRCYSYHNYGNPYGSIIGEVGSGTVIPGNKLRITEYQAAIGLAQMARLEEQTTIRNNNAEYLRGKIRDIPGILPYKFSDKVTRAAFHIFPFRYKKEYFNGLSREGFLKALQAEGVTCSGGYSPLNKMPYLENTFKSQNFKLMYPGNSLDYKSYMERNQCPVDDQVCKEAVWFMQNMLLGTESDMDDIAAAIEKIHVNAEKINLRINSL
jgi:dTDP-4-amino-4,6-dideoxygalactose transaminase